MQNCIRSSQLKSHMHGGGAHEVVSLLSSYWQLMAASRGGVSLLQLPVLVDGFTAMHTQAALGGLCVYPGANKAHEIGREKWEGIAREGMDLVTTHMHI